MKYRIKKARGYYRIARTMQGNMHVYTIMAKGATISRITYTPVRTFADLYIAMGVTK